MRRLWIVGLGVALLAGCAQEVDGPAPEITSVIHCQIPAGSTVTEEDEKTCSSLSSGSSVICKCNDSACVNTNYVLMIKGSGFAPLPVSLLEDPGIWLPTVYLRRGTVTKEIDGKDPSKNSGATLKYWNEGTLQLTLSATFVNSLEVGKWDVVVRNPNENEDKLAGGLEVVLGPVLESIKPDQACSVKSTEITLSGKNFRRGAKVHVDNEELTSVTFVDSTTIKATVPSGRQPGDYDVTVTNPEGCYSTLTDGLTIFPPPTLTSVTPSTICTGGTLTLKGKDFVDGATVKIGSATLKGSSVVVSSDGTTITVNVGPITPGGPYDVSVENPGSCAPSDGSNTLKAAVTVQLGPIIVAVDPTTVYNKVDFPITIFGSGFSTGITGTVDASPAVALKINSVTSDRIDAVVPKGIKPGTYDITVKDTKGCSYTIKGALKVTDQLTVQICSIDPPFGYTKENTDVTITSKSSTTTGTCSTGTKTFTSTPRAWLDINGTLTALKAVAYVDSVSLTGTVPANLTVGGPYDLVVQNPEGDIGLLTKAFEVVSKPVPQIDSINPGDTDTQYVGTLTLYGKNFRSPVTIELIDASGTKSALSAPTAIAAGTQASATLNVGTLGLSTGAYLVRLTNTDQKTYYDYSALAITNPSGNLGAWSTTATSMTTARRRHAMVGGHISAAARFLYAIGGDGGSSATAPLDSVDLCPLTKFGNTGTWVKQRYKLNTARTALTAVAQGNYVWVIGGDDGKQALSSIERARILDPDDAPEIDTFSFSLGGSLAKGAWYYRVAAVMSSSDQDNPSGESLPSDPVVIHAIDNVVVKLSWKAVTGAAFYRVYRSPKAGSAYGDEQLLKDNISATSLTFTDDGKTATDPKITPLVKGSTGVFVTSSVTLKTARAGHALTASTVGSTTYVYVAGGRTGSGSTLLDSVEYAAFTAADGSTLGSFTTATNSLPEKRERLMLVQADHDSSPLVPAGTNYLFVGGGADTTGGTLKAGLSSALNQTSAQPGTWAASAEIKNAPFAAVGYLTNDTFYWFGGSTGTSVLATARSCEFTTPPAFSNCNSLAAGSLPSARMNAALALESAFFYISGGGATDGAATTSVIQTVY